MEQDSEDRDTAIDSLGIPGWDKVDALATVTALLELTGLSVKSAQVEHIKELYANLPLYNKKPLSFESKRKKAMTSQSKCHRSGHVSEEVVKRCHYFTNFIIFFHLATCTCTNKSGASCLVARQHIHQIRAELLRLCA